MIIDGKKLAQNIYDDLKKQTEVLETKPCLNVILVWKNEASVRYVKQKQKWAKYCGFDFKLREFSENITQEELLKEIDSINNDDSINWLIIQLPLPNHIDTKKIINNIEPKKDVDWFHPINQWKVLIDDKSWIIPCTPKWIMHIFESENIDLKWKNIVVIWRSNIVWKPITALLINAWATVTSCNSHTKDLRSHTKNADMIISAVWKPWLLKLDMINDSSVVIDVAFWVYDWVVCWDADFSDINNNWNLITPVPWWVWPLTVAMLMKNTFEAYKKW